MENIVNPSILFNKADAERMERLRFERDAAIKTVRGEQDILLNKVVMYLKANPDAVMTAGDIAEMSGISRSAVRSWFDAKGWRQNIRTIKVTMVRYYAEVDSDSKLIPNGRTMKTSWSATGYTYNGRNW